ncbi:unnamed protein product, partial [Cyprideis torosa]
MPATVLSSVTNVCLSQGFWELRHTDQRRQFGLLQPGSHEADRMSDNIYFKYGIPHLDLSAHEHFQNIIEQVVDEFQKYRRVTAKQHARQASGHHKARKSIATCCSKTTFVKYVAGKSEEGQKKETRIVAKSEELTQVPPNVAKEKACTEAISLSSTTSTFSEIGGCLRDGDTLAEYFCGKGYSSKTLHLSSDMEDQPMQHHNGSLRDPLLNLTSASVIEYKCCAEEFCSETNSFFDSSSKLSSNSSDQTSDITLMGSYSDINSIHWFVKTSSEEADQISELTFLDSNKKSLESNIFTVNPWEINYCNDIINNGNEIRSVSLPVFKTQEVQMHRRKQGHRVEIFESIRDGEMESEALSERCQSSEEETLQNGDTKEKLPKGALVLPQSERSTGISPMLFPKPKESELEALTDDSKDSLMDSIPRSIFDEASVKTSLQANRANLSTHKSTVAIDNLENIKYYCSNLSTNFFTEFDCVSADSSSVSSGRHPHFSSSTIHGTEEIKENWQEQFGDKFSQPYETSEDSTQETDANSCIPLKSRESNLRRLDDDGEHSNLFEGHVKPMEAGRDGAPENLLHQIVKQDSMDLQEQKIAMENTQPEDLGEIIQKITQENEERAAKEMMSAPLNCCKNERPELFLETNAVETPTIHAPSLSTINFSNSDEEDSTQSSQPHCRNAVVTVSRLDFGCGERAWQKMSEQDFESNASSLPSSTEDTNAVDEEESTMTLLYEETDTSDQFSLVERNTFKIHHIHHIRSTSLLSIEELPPAIFNPQHDPHGYNRVCH